EIERVRVSAFRSPLQITGMRQLAFPTEVIFCILREATLVPEALDTSPSIFFENRDVVLQLVHDSMKTKASLSLVSKTFHNVMEFYLYEIVMIFRFEYVPILLRSLRTTPLGFCIPRGHRCRRLDFYLGIGNIIYADEAWYEGGHTLWGLIPTCPKLEILMARVVRSVQGLDFPHLTHKALWKTIVAYSSKTLRRIELYGFWIRTDRLEMMLRYLTNLEACRIIGARKFDPHLDTYDDEEPKKRHLGRNRKICLKDDWDYSKLSGWFDASTVEEFKAAKEKSQWPPFDSPPPYTLPSLHTLRVDRLDLKRLHQFSFPRLRHLDMTCFPDNRLDLCATYTHFPSSVTHLIYGGDYNPLVHFLQFFPQVRQLTLALEFGDFPASNYEFVAPHLHLEIVELATWDYNLELQPRIRDILTAVRAEKVPSLHTIKLTPPWKYKELPLVEECDALGVRLEQVVRPEPTFCGMSKRHQE
ncbi:hypothetical protein C0993_009244, partial [Termitomyces sp. T159_Od127]